MQRRWLSGAAALALMPITALAQDARTDIGLLTCSLAASGEADGGADVAAMLLVKKMLCTFRPNNSGPEETYTGAYESVDQDHQPAGGRVMIWIVKSTAETKRSAGLLQQAYAMDRTASSRHPPPLIGETNSTIVLQPMTDAQAQAAADKQPMSSIIVLVALELWSSPG
jgi:hypothetical protein